MGFAWGLDYYVLICAGVNIVVGPLKLLVGFIRKLNVLMLGPFFSPKLGALRDVSGRKITQEPMETVRELVLTPSPAAAKSPMKPQLSQINSCLEYFPITQECQIHWISEPEVVSPFASPGLT